MSGRCGEGDLTCDRHHAPATEQAGSVDALGLVSLCQMLEVPAGWAVPGDMAPGADDDRALKRELLELTRAYADIASPVVRQTLLQLVKAAACR